MPENTNTMDAAAVVGAAEKSFFESKLVTVLTKGVPAIKELIPYISILLFGVQDSKEQKELRKIYSELGKISAELGVVSVSTVYLSVANSVKQKIAGINTILEDKRMDSLTDAELKELCDFLTPGLGATIYTNYKSCVANLLKMAYGVELDDALNSTPQSPCAMGLGKSEAVAVNDSVLTKAQTITDYLDAHMKFAVEIAALVLAVCMAANDAYNFLKKNEEAIKVYFNSQRMAITLEDVLKTIRNEKVKADISEITTSTFLSARLAPSLATAPAHLCGTAYRLFTAMRLNTTQPGAANTNISISRAEGYAAPADNSRFYTENKIHGYQLEYIPGQTFWTASFSNNNTVSNYINLAGRHGGFLGLVHDGANSYAYEITGNTGINQEPPYKWNKCIWQLMVRHDKDGQLVFMFVNKEYSKTALANNHGFLMPTKPGHYRFEEDNIDEYWTVKML
jgi:hypothetical protein